MKTITNKRLNFQIEAEADNSSARACTLTTLHNTVQTPVFMPVATLAVLRDQDTSSVEALGFPVLLANTYHLILRPGTEVFEKFGGIHSFMKWPRSVLTDSGGFQIYSLPGAVKISEEGASFRSYHDGRIIMLSPETSIGAQKMINSDIMMALDQCVPSTSDKNICRDAMNITTRWAERSLEARGDSPQSIFGIVQGACSPDLRRISAKQISSLPFDGFAIGGLAVGETADERKDITELTAYLLPRDYPRYLMGVGTPIDLLEAVHRGVDMFDCILPTSLAQQGVAYTSNGRIELRRGVHKYSARPLDENCSCPACTRYSRAYLHHLVKTGEFFGSNLIGTHNLTFYKNLMKNIREQILAGTFSSFYNDQKEHLQRRDVEHPVKPPKKKNNKSLPSLGVYEAVLQEGGFHSIRHKVSNEIMHSVNDPLHEAHSVYVNQSKLHHLIDEPNEDPIAIWDVGLGAGTNAMAAILEYEKLYSQKTHNRILKIISFEKDLDSFRLTASNASLFPHMRHGAPSHLLKNGRWHSTAAPIEWTLVEGDFAEKMGDAISPDFIYYDPFSQNTESPMWRYDLFKKIYNHCTKDKVSLFTYSGSTMVRAALLAAGFFVGRGAGSGPRTDTTAAFSSVKNGTGSIELLDTQWLQRFQRSSSKFSDHSSPEEKLLIEERVTSHKQFSM